MSDTWNSEPGGANVPQRCSEQPPTYSVATCDVKSFEQSLRVFSVASFNDG